MRYEDGPAASPIGRARPRRCTRQERGGRAGSVAEAVLLGTMGPSSSADVLVHRATAGTDGTPAEVRDGSGADRPERLIVLSRFIGRPRS